MFDLSKVNATFYRNFIMNEMISMRNENKWKIFEESNCNCDFKYIFLEIFSFVKYIKYLIIKYIKVFLRRKLFLLFTNLNTLILLCLTFYFSQLKLYRLRSRLHRTNRCFSILRISRNISYYRNSRNRCNSVSRQTVNGTVS